MKVKMSKKQWKAIRGYLGLLTANDIGSTISTGVAVNEFDNAVDEVEEATQQLFSILAEVFPKNKYL